MRRRGLTPQERQQTLAQAALIVAEKMYRGGQIDRAMNHWREALAGQGQRKAVIVAYQTFLNLPQTLPMPRRLADA